VVQLACWPSSARGTQRLGAERGRNAFDADEASPRGSLTPTPDPDRRVSPRTYPGSAQILHVVALAQARLK